MDERPPESRIRRDASENRRRLLAAAKRLFGERGVEATPMQEVARAAGVGQGTLYRHFSDKGALCHALIREDVSAFQQRVGALIEGPGAGTPLERVEMLIAEKIAITESHLPLFAAIDAAGSARPRAARGPFSAWLHERLAALLREAIALGELPELDVEITADAILAATAPPLYSFQRHTLGYSPERISAGLRQLFVQAPRRPVSPVSKHSGDNI